jgi:hypothetical protein
MQIIKPTLCALAIISAATATAQTGYGRYYHRMYVRGGWAYGTRDYYYGPDGYYARCKEKNKSYRSRPYRSERVAARPVFERARYAEDRSGRPYLYFPSQK